MQNQFFKSEAIGFGWNVAKSNLGFFVLLFLLYYAVFLALGIVGGIIGKDVVLLSAIVSLASWIIGIVMSMGFIKIYLKLVDGQKPVYHDLFLNYHLFLNYLLGSIVYGLLIAIGLILFIIPGVYFALKFQFASYFIIDKGVDPITAFKMSSKMTQGMKINLLLFDILLFLVIIAGFLALGVGLVLAVPTTSVALAFVYRKLSSQVTSS